MRAVNLLPQDARRRPASANPRGAYAVLGTLGVLLAMVAGYVLTSNTVNEHRSEAANARAEADRLEAEVAARGSFTDFAAIKQQRLSSVAGVAQGRFDWERLMRELARIMPERSWLQETNASTLGDPSGEAAAAAATADPATAAVPQPTANLVGCTPRQSDVARMMVRLRALHRVDDVKLNESAQEGDNADDDASVDNCGRFYKFDLSVTFTPLAPGGEAPKGATGVPASLGGGS